MDNRVQRGRVNVKGVKGAPKTGRRMAARQKGGKAAHAEALQTAQQAERRAKVWDLFAHQHLTYRQIAKAVGVVEACVAKDIWAVADQLAQQTLDTAAHWREVQLAALDAADRAILPALYGSVPGRTVMRKVMRKGRLVQIPVTEAPDPVDVEHLKIAAHRQLVKSQELRARLLGTMAPVKIAPTTPNGARPYQSWSDDELDRAIQERVRLLGGASSPVTIDVTPKQIEGVVEGDGDKNQGNG